MSAEGFVGGDGLSERCQPAATHRTLRAAAPVAVFGGQLQQCLRLEGVGRMQIVETPAAHEAVLLGGNGFEQREGPLAQPLVAVVGTVGVLDQGDEGSDFILPMRLGSSRVGVAGM